MTKRDFDREGLWPISRASLGDGARILNQWSVYPKLPSIPCLHSSFSLTNVWERQITAAVIIKCNNCEGISKVKRFIRWPLHHDHVKELHNVDNKEFFQCFHTTSAFLFHRSLGLVKKTISSSTSRKKTQREINQREFSICNSSNPTSLDRCC